MKESSICSHVKGSASYGKWTFPTRSDYEKYFLEQQTINNVDELWYNDALISEIQKHWHSRGQNGCVFAQAIASNASKRGWEMLVINHSLEYIETFQETIEYQIHRAIDLQDCQILSLLFPKVVTPNELVQLIRFLIQIPSIILLSESLYEELVTLSLRIAITPDGVLSWLMGFGPFTFFPNTRQAPVTEIAIRTKPKPDKIFEKLNQDKQAAHLADTPTYMRDEVFHTLWKSTYIRTRTVLGNEPDQFSAAKVTVSVPREIWSK